MCIQPDGPLHIHLDHTFSYHHLTSSRSRRPGHDRVGPGAARSRRAKEEEWVLCVCGWRFVCGSEGVGVLWGFLVCEGVRVFLCVLVLV